MVCACLLLAFTAVYRFNTLGGTFGGFDNDHFVPFAYAKQVQAGQQPLRDFSGLGLQGAWPSLTYEVSAWGQRVLGSNLRSEALVTVAGVAIAASLTFVAASLLSNSFWAFLATLVSVFVAPTLYNYPKVLVLSATALAIALYARRPGVRVVVASAVLTAIAFLFRHDYAVFAGVGIVLGCLATGDWMRGGRHIAIYAGVTLLLLVPSLVYVQYHAGLVQYARDSVLVSQREAERTGLTTWPAFTLTAESGGAISAASFFDVEQNGVAWLYYLTRLLPFVAAIVAWTIARPQVRAATLAIAGMAAFTAPFWLRGNVAVRLGDVGPLIAILLAAVCSEAVRARIGDRPARRAWRVVPVLVLCSATALSAETVGYVRNQLNTAGLSWSFSATRLRMSELSAALAALPEAAIADPRPDNPLKLARYINRCTAPADRVVMMAYEPETLPYAGRLFGAGRVSVIPKYILDDHNEAELVAFWQRETVPLAIVEFDEFVEGSRQFPLVRGYVRDHYRESGRIALSSSRTLRVFARTDRAVVSTFDHEQLPCFR